MNIHEVSIALSSAFSISLLVALFKLWRDCQTDELRQELFQIRDELFDFARQREGGLDNPAYQWARVVLNSFIRYGHRFSVVRILLTAVMQMVAPAEKSGRSLRDTLKKFDVQDGPLQERIVGSFNKASLAITKFLFVSSPPLLLMLALYRACISLMHLIELSLHTQTQQSRPTPVLGAARNFPGLEQMEWQAIAADPNQTAPQNLPPVYA